MARKEMLMFYIETFPFLKRLELNCENEFSSECLDKLVKNGMNNQMETLFYGCNYHMNMAYAD